MTRDELLAALKRLGDLLPEEAQIIIAGGKFYGGRVVDFEDLAEIRPTDEEIAFVLSQLERIARFRPDKAFKMQLYIEQGRATKDQGDP